MVSVAQYLQVVAGSTLIWGSRLGIAGMFLFPMALFLSNWLGDRVFRLYSLATAATVGLLIARVLAHLVHSASIG